MNSTDGKHIRGRVRRTGRRLKTLSREATLGGIFLSFLKIGLTGFGGGLAVIAQIRTLTVRKRRWLTEHEFSEAFALAQSLPGTNAGNAVAYIGLRLRGWRGASVALTAFVLPSMLMMILLAILHRHLRALPEIERLFHGLNAGVVALIIVTAFRIGKTTLLQKWQWLIAACASLAVIIFRAPIIEVILLAGLIGIYRDSFAERRWQRWRRIRQLAAQRRARLAELESRNFVGGYLTRALAEERVRRMNEAALIDPNHIGAISDAIDADAINADGDSSENKINAIDENTTSSDENAMDAHTASSDKDESETIEASTPRTSKTRLNSIAIFAVAMPLMTKFALLLALVTVFFRVGAVTFGGGFVMIPLIEAEVVEKHGWLSHQEFADATALGQITPGPVLITATFIGFKVAGTLGALIATISVFLPAFLMTIVAGSSLRRFRANRQVQSFLRGVTPAVVGLLIAAAWSIGRAGIHTWLGVCVAIIATLVYARFRINAFWIMFGTGLLGFLLGKAGW